MPVPASGPPGPRVAVVGSVNLDLVARVERLPGPGETLTARAVTRHPGGKGANQALAAARLGAAVRLHAAVGDDPLAGEALALLRAGHVDLAPVGTVDAPTGTAMIQVDDAGETTIVVDTGANGELAVAAGDVADAEVVITVLEVPDAAVATAAAAPGFTVLNAAPARPVASEVLAGLDLLVVNTDERDLLARRTDLDALAAVAVTHGARGAELRRHGDVIARAEPPAVDVVDGTGAGDAFTAALAIALATGDQGSDRGERGDGGSDRGERSDGGSDRGERSDGGSDRVALRWACAAGALAATRRGAQPSLPTRAEVEDILR